MDTKDILINIRTESGMSRQIFCEYFDIPYRTVQDWELGNRQMPSYLLSLIQYRLKYNEKLFNNSFIQGEDYNDSPILLAQALISKKKTHNAFSVERDYINSKFYTDIFTTLPVNHEVRNSVYKEAGRLLEAVDGVEEEHLIAISARTGSHIVDNLNRPGKLHSTSFDESEYQKIDSCIDNIILLHNHSLNGRPSAQDLLTYLKEDKVKLSIILCHDGTVYVILNVDERLTDIYQDYLTRAKTFTSDDDEAKHFATTRIYQLNDQLSEKHKLFTIWKL